jgi:putative Mg2+ transporter-C (MgtC) family protein
LILTLARGNVITPNKTWDFKKQEGVNMEFLWNELIGGIPDVSHLTRILVRFAAAILLGGVVGLERERMGKPAGLRTHILVCLGPAVFILACSESEFTADGLSRVIQGILAGIGFIGAGSILKTNEKQDVHVHGLTTAAGIWMTAAIGVAIGLGRLGIALLSTLFILIILTLARKLEHRRRELAIKQSCATEDHE